MMKEPPIRIEDVLNGKYRFVEGQPVRRSYVDMENIGIENMKYKVGDKVRINSIDWYNENKNKFGNVWGHYPFDKDMSKYCGKVMTISHIRGDHYTMVENLVNYWTDNMIECKVEDEIETEETKNDNDMETETHRGYYTTEPETTCEGKKRCVVYFWDNDFADKVELDLSNRELIQEDGKWFVVKKKKEYPKTYEECCAELNNYPFGNGVDGYKFELLSTFQNLIICRDAYWKIAGEEMGLNRPWKPDYDSGVNKYGIICLNGVVQESNPTTNWERHLNKVLDFPTAEMRDAFKENFDPDIEICKEFL